MREYETIYLAKASITPEQANKIKEKLQGALDKFESKKIHFVDWGKRKLAYEVQKEPYARYFYLSYLSNNNVTAELERLLKYDDQVVKFLSVCVAQDVDAEARLQKPGEPPAPPADPAARYSQDNRGQDNRGPERPAPAGSAPKTEFSTPDKPPVSEAEAPAEQASADEASA